MEHIRSTSKKNFNPEPEGVFPKILFYYISDARQRGIEINQPGNSNYSTDLIICKKFSQFGDFLLDIITDQS